jgi:hypothetical protein
MDTNADTLSLTQLIIGYFKVIIDLFKAKILQKSPDVTQL